MSHPIATARLLLASCIVALATFACGGGGGYKSPTSPPPPPPPSNGVVVEIRDFSFSPKSITVSPGDTVTWRLTGSAGIGHTVTSAAAGFNSGANFNSVGAQFSHTFTAADTGKTFTYYCSTHQVCCQMQGSVRVGETAPPPPPNY
jgi:plastocyanin